MTKQLLYSTTNPSKAADMRELLKSLPLKLLSLQDVAQYRQITEDGNTLAENAQKKAQFFFAEVGLPTLAVDTGLSIHRFPTTRQPGLFVRRICGTGIVISDNEMLDYYQDELKKVGGQSKGIWTTAVALVVEGGRIFCDTFSSETLFIAEASDIRMPGEPLNSLQIDPVSGKYYSEMTPAERIRTRGQRSVGIIDFVKKHLAKI